MVNPAVYDLVPMSILTGALEGALGRLKSGLNDERRVDMYVGVIASFARAAIKT